MADTRNRATDALLLQGTNGPESVYPFWGTFKSIREISREVSRENRRVLYWLFLLLLAAASAAVAFSVKDSPLPPWWQIAALIAVGGIAERLSIRVTTEVEMIYDKWTYLPQMRLAAEKFDAHISTLLAR